MRFAFAVLSALALVACSKVPLSQTAGAIQADPPSAPVTTPPPSTPPASTPPPEPPADANVPPVLEGSPALIAKVGSAYSFKPTATDADGDALTFTIYGKPSWAAFDESTGELSGTPADDDVGTTDEIEIAVSDGAAQDSVGPFRIQVGARNVPPPPTNSAPTLSGSPTTSVFAGQAYVFAPAAQDADGDKLTFAISNRPRWATFNTSNGRLTGTPSAAQIGTTSSIRISVTDGAATTLLAPFSIQVAAPPNGAPSISGTPATRVTAGLGYAFQPGASDPDGDKLSFAIQNRPAWASFDVNTGRLSGTPAESAVGTSSNIRISVSDGTHSVTLAPFAVTVAEAPNRAPLISGTPPLNVSAGSAYSFTPTVSDADGDTLSFSIQNKPAWATFSASTGRLSGTPTTQQTGSFAGITISVSDGDESAALPAFTIAVSAAANRAPVISGSPARNVAVSAAYNFTPTASDPDGDRLTFSIENMPVWGSFDTSTGRLSGTPSAQRIGIYPGIVISASDGKTSASLSSFSITVAAPENRAPLISGTPASNVVAGLTYTFTPTASDADGDSLTFSVRHLPAWASFNTSTGRVAGTPNAQQTGNYPGIVISVSDGDVSTSLPTFAIAVTEAPNRAPVITGSPARNVFAGVAYGFTPVASDPDGDTLRFTVQNLPSWAAFSNVTGRLSGTPTAQQTGSYAGIVITVSDGDLSTSLPAFGITVSAVNVAPVISGTPATTVAAGETYSFTPTASDPDDDDLTFSIQNKPSWATFNSSTGRLSGTPDDTDAGTDSGIVIRVSDGAETVSLRAFAITVTAPESPQPGTGTVTLTWIPPTTNTDGSTLTDLAGYRIYYGTTQANLDRTQTVTTSGVSSYTIEDLASGKWYFAIRAYSRAGVESNASNIANKTLP